MELAKLFPITTTSANLSGRKPSGYVNGVVEQLDGSVDLILDGGKSENESPSTVIDLTLNPPKVVREGSYKFNNIKILKKKYYFADVSFSNFWYHPLLSPPLILGNIKLR